MNRFLLGSQLLSYPTQEFVEHLLPDTPLSVWLKSEDLYTVQEHYVELFDRGRKCSLYLFEHVHGDSRERGSALVSLKEMYAGEGWDLTSQELPDYFPVFLEFLSLVSSERAEELLKEVGHIVARICENLEERHSPYASLVRSFVADNSLAVPKKEEEDVDKAWEEVPVTFNKAPCMQGKSCGG